MVRVSEFDRIVEPMQPGPLTREIQELLMSANDPPDYSTVTVRFPVSAADLVAALDAMPEPAHDTIIAAAVITEGRDLTPVGMYLRLGPDPSMPRG